MLEAPYVGKQTTDFRRLRLSVRGPAMMIVAAASKMEAIRLPLWVRSVPNERALQSVGVILSPIVNPELIT